MDKVLEDKRFAHVGKDPRYRQMKREERKVKIDKRFHSMFQDKRFKLKYTVDKRGRPIHTTTNENLKKYYELSSSSSEESDDEDSDADSADDQSAQSELESDSESDDNSVRESKENPMKKKLEEERSVAKGKAKATKKIQPSDDKKRTSAKDKTKSGKAEHKKDPKTNLDKKTMMESGSSDEMSSSDGDETDESENPPSSSKAPNLDVGLGGPDYARGEAVMESSSDEEDEDEGGEEEEFSHDWGELDKSAPAAEEVTHRLAVCNMDWDRIKANDLLVLFNSFKPAGSVIHSVTIYPSEYGQQRLAQEERHGPSELVQQKVTDSDGEADTTSAEGEKYHREKLRQYQLNRLKYYYAVLECDSPNTANHLYEHCDGIEYESSATKVDLRFIPEDMIFDQEPKSVAKDVPDMATYKPTLFSNTALQQSKVDLTWDETDRDRVAVTMRKFNKDDIEEMDVQAYLASDSESEEDPYGGVEDASFGGQASDAEEDDDEDEEQQIQKYRKLLLGTGAAETETSKSSDKNMEMEITWEPGLKETTEDLVKKSSKKKEAQTPWEEYLEKKREKKRQRKEEEGGKKQQKKAKGSQEDADGATISDDEPPAGIDMNDSYFKEEIDALQGKPDKKKSKGKKKLKQKMKQDKEKDSGKTQDEAELSLLLCDEDDQKEHFSLKAIMEKEQQASKKKKKLKRKKKAAKDDVPVTQDAFEVDVEDSRFSALYEDARYNIDPSAAEFKKTKAMDALIGEKQQRRQKRGKDGGKKATHAGSGDSIVPGKKARTEESYSSDALKPEKTPVAKDPALANLIKSVKAKTQTLQEKKKLKKKKLTSVKY